MSAPFFGLADFVNRLEARQELRGELPGLREIQRCPRLEDALERDVDSIIDKLDVSSAPNTASFWSGNKEGAYEFAISNNKTVLETTPGGRIVNDWNLLSKALRWDIEGEKFWGGISRKYASGVAGGNFRVTIA